VEYGLLAVLLISTVAGARFAGRSSRQTIRGAALGGLSCFALALAGVLVLVAGLPLPLHPYLMGFLVFVLLVCAAVLLPFGLIGLWVARSHRR